MPRDQLTGEEPDTARVEAYCGYMAPERPRAFVWRGRRHTVERILRRWKTPHAMGFRVRTDDGLHFEVMYLVATETWTARPLPGPFTHNTQEIPK
jgi:hypothetical protein